LLGWRRRPDRPPLCLALFWAGSAARSARLDGPEAVGAVDRPIHPRLEGHLGLVPARRADHREVLAGRSILPALVAARPADVVEVVAALARSTPAGAAARAALRIGGEPLLCVELLVGRRVDELHA